MFWPASEWRRAVDAENCCVINVFHAKLKVVALDIRQWEQINRDNPLTWYLSSRSCDVMEINQTLPKRIQTIDCETRIISLIANFDCSERSYCSEDVPHHEPEAAKLAVCLEAWKLYMCMVLSLVVSLTFSANPHGLRTSQENGRRSNCHLWKYWILYRLRRIVNVHLSVAGMCAPTRSYPPKTALFSYWVLCLSR